MTRILALATVALAIATGAANADPLKDAAKYGNVVTTGGILSAR